MVLGVVVSRRIALTVVLSLVFAAVPSGWVTQVARAAEAAATVAGDAESAVWEAPPTSVSDGPSAADRVAEADQEHESPAISVDGDLAVLAPGEEVVGRRSEYARTVATANADRFVTEVFDRPVHFRGAAGAWERIDPRLTPVGPGAVGNAADAVDTEIATRASASSLGRVVLPGGGSISFRLAGAAAVEGDVSATSVSYESVLPGVDVRLSSVPGGLKEELVLASPSAQRVFDFPLELQGLTASLTDAGEVALTDDAGRVRGVIPQGWMVEVPRV